MVGGLRLPGLWLFVAPVVDSEGLADKTVCRPGAKKELGSLSPVCADCGSRRSSF